MATEPNPNDLDFFRAGEPIVGLSGKVTEWSFDQFRAGEPSRTLLLPGISPVPISPVAIQGASLVNCTVVRIRSLAVAPIQGRSTVTVTVERLIPVTASITGHSTVTTAVTRTRGITATIQGASVVTADLTKLTAITAAIAGRSEVNVRVEIIPPTPTGGTAGGGGGFPAHAEWVDRLLAGQADVERKAEQELEEVEALVALGVL